MKLQTSEVLKFEDHDVEALEQSTVTITESLSQARHRSKLILSLGDVSFWVGIVFILGSTVWVVNGFLLFLPLLGDAPEEPILAWLGLTGGSLFEIGSYLMFLESLNREHTRDFGPALLRLFSCRRQRHDLVEKHSASFTVNLRNNITFRWIGIRNDINFWGNSIQLLAASVFWISTVTGLPGVIPNFATSTAIVDIFFWSPQVIGGINFIISSYMFMLEVQRAWWIPNLFNLIWQVGWWNSIGAWGFTLCGAIGYGAEFSSKANYQSVLATFWGSWAFLIGSVLQLYVAIIKEDTSVGDADGIDTVTVSC